MSAADGEADRSGKANCRNPEMHVDGMSRDNQGGKRDNQDGKFFDGVIFEDFGSDLTR